MPTSIASASILAISLFILGIPAQALAQTKALQPIARQQQKPNVLMIAIDDLNDWIEPLGGHPQSRTPHLARMAKTAVCFTNAHCQAPICNPSRISLLIGKYPSTTGVYYLGPRLRAFKGTQAEVSLPQHFSKNGYKTLAAGKIFHAGGKGEFQTYAGNFGGFGPRPKKAIHGGQTHPLWDWGMFPENESQMPDAKIADWTARQLAADHQKPFFLACGFYRPHVPMFAPKKYFDMHPLDRVRLPETKPDDFDDIPEYASDLSWSLVAPRHQWMVDHSQWKNATQSYLASVSFVDAQVGKVLDALEKSKYRDNTIVVLWSDHGFHVGTKNRWGKRSLWTDSTRVALMVSGPKIRGGQKCNRPVGLIDLYPTLIDLCDLNPKEGLEGRSLQPLLKDPDSEWDRPALTTFGKNNHTLRGQRYRYTIYSDSSEELYDLQNDPHEFDNLIRKIPESYKLAKVRESLRRHLPKINRDMAPGSHNADARPGSAAEIPADRRRRLNKKK